jgi:DNA-binding MarR family transcriptional regulator
MPLSRLSERLLVHPTSVTSTVNTLQRLGFVDRLSHPNDRRSTLARITLKGRRAMKQTTRALAEDRLGLSALDEREAERLFDLLRRVRADAGDLKHAFRRADPEGVAIDPVLVAESNWESRGWVARPHFRAGLSIYHCAELIRQAMTDAMAPHGLTFVLHEALAVLFFSRRGEMPMGKLGDRLLVHPTSVTSTIDRLENLELVRRMAHPTDRRATLAGITPKGRRAVASSSIRMAELRFGMTALSASQAKAVYTILARVRLSVVR